MPGETAAIAFGILFKTVAKIPHTTAANPRRGGLRVDGTAVLDAWNQKLCFHPHRHVLAPNASFDVESDQWKTGNGAWRAPVRVLASFFRRRFLEELDPACGRADWSATARWLGVLLASDDVQIGIESGRGVESDNGESGWSSGMIGEDRASTAPLDIQERLGGIGTGHHDYGWSGGGRQGST